MALRLDVKSREMHLILPKRVSLKKAVNFAYAHENWIVDQLAGLPVPVPFENGAVLPLFGRDVLLRVICDPALKTTKIDLRDDELLVSTYLENPAGRITRYLKGLAREALTGLAHEKAVQIKKTIKSIQIRDTKSRWGSCGHDGRLSFSWRLILAPPDSMDYVAAHEVAHTVRMNHTPEFWALCEELSVDFSAGKGWMRGNGHSLMRYGQSLDRIA